MLKNEGLSDVFMCGFISISVNNKVKNQHFFIKLNIIIPCNHGNHQNEHTIGFLAIFIGCLATICKTVNNLIIL